jgi:hypothetical protein
MQDWSEKVNGVESIPKVVGKVFWDTDSMNQTDFFLFANNTIQRDYPLF